MKWMFNDGGRKEAGFRTKAPDCAARAFCIANECTGDYGAVLKQIGLRPSRYVYNRFLAAHGWEWIPTCAVGTSERTHMREDELPKNEWLILYVSKHFAAYKDGVVYDTYDPSRKGTRLVYGYWRKKQ